MHNFTHKDMKNPLDIVMKEQVEYQHDKKIVVEEEEEKGFMEMR